MASKTISSAGCYGTYNITAGQAAWAWESGSQCDGAKYSLNDFPAVARNQDDIEIETGTTWTTAIVGVRQVTTSSDGANRVALFQQPGAAIAQGAFNGNAQVGGTHKLMNAYEFLDAPGEFYFDKGSRTLYYYKASAENMSTATVYAPNNVTTLLRVAGTSTSSHARNITFSGLTVQHSDWNLFNVAGSVLQAGAAGQSRRAGVREGQLPRLLLPQRRRHSRHRPDRRTPTGSSCSATGSSTPVPTESTWSTTCRARS